MLCHNKGYNFIFVFGLVDELVDSKGKKFKKNDDDVIIVPQNSSTRCQNIQRKTKNLKEKPLPR